MKDRIQKIIDEKNLTPSRFADEVGLNRPAVSHILNGRNNPGLDALQKILNRFPDINATWLITGKGNMFNNSIQGNNPDNSPTLFDENPVFTDEIQDEPEYPKEIASKEPLNTVKSSEIQIDIPQKAVHIKVKKIAVFYSDNTYQEFIPSENS